MLFQKRLSVDDMLISAKVVQIYGCHIVKHLSHSCRFM